MRDLAGFGRAGRGGLGGLVVASLAAVAMLGGCDGGTSAGERSTLGKARDRGIEVGEGIEARQREAMDAAGESADAGG